MDWDNEEKDIKNSKEKSNMIIDSVQLSEIISDAVKEQLSSYNIDELTKHFPEGVKVIKDANEKLTEDQKKKMVKLMEWFIENELPQEKD